jgi:hypothetical protein
MEEFVKPRRLGIPDERVNIPLKTLQTQGMTDQNLKDHWDMVPADGYECIYGGEDGMLPEFGIRYLGKKLIVMGDIIIDGKYQSQIYRSGPNPNGEAITNSIRENGYSIRELPIFVLYDPKTKTYQIFDGRTRLVAFEVLNIPKNCKIVVDAYEIVDETKDVKGFPMFANTIGYMKGKPSEECVCTYLSSRIVDGFITFDKTLPEPVARMQLMNNLKEECLRVKIQLPQKRLEQLLREAAKGEFSFLKTFSFKNAREAEQYCENELGMEMSDKDTIRVCVHSDQNNLLKNMMSRIPETDKRNIEVIVYATELNFSDPVKQWNTAALKIYRKMQNAVRDAETLLVPNKTGESRIKILGSIPQCEALEAKFPLNKLVKFDELTEDQLNGIY